ncbi:MAG: LysR family transcriptional regulator [Chloroflexi bacterium]|nr:LysR family transcriptional regulator [Chloroflexota bacterium]
MPETPVLYYLHTFATVARERSFTRAAQNLNLSQPAVSAHIRALEGYYGAKLFETRQRRTCLTTAGEALLAYTERVFHLLDEADQVLDATRAGQSGVLRFGASTTLGNYLLPRVLGGYAHGHSAVSLETVVGTSADVLGWVKSERAQFGFVEAPLHDSQVEVEAIGQDELILAAAVNHRLARTGPLRPASLARLPILRREASSGTQQLVDGELTRSGAGSPTQLVLGSTEALKQAVIEGVGVAWLPRLAIARELSSGELQRVPVTGLAISRTLSLIRLRGANLSAAGQALVEDVRRALSISCADA